nr:MAG TPA: BppU domain protein [Caudoviricetes sp.]
MITVRGRQLVIPRDENQIGTTYDDNSEVRRFLIDRVTFGGIDLSHLNFRLDLEYQGEKKDTSLLDVEVREDSILLTWTIPHSCLTAAGTVWIAIRGYDDNGTVKWATNKGAVYVEDTIDTPGSNPPGLTELEQLERRIEEKTEMLDANEGERQQNEVIRQENEQRRQNNEAEWQRQAETAIGQANTTLQGANDAKEAAQGSATSAAESATAANASKEAAASSAQEAEESAAEAQRISQGFAGFDGTALSVPAVDVQGLVGQAGSTSNVQAMLDYLAVKVAQELVGNEALTTKLLDYVTKSSIVQTESTDPTTVPSSPYFKQVTGKLISDLATSQNAVLLYSGNIKANDEISIPTLHKYKLFHLGDTQNELYGCDVGGVVGNVLQFNLLGSVSGRAVFSAIKLHINRENTLKVIFNTQVNINTNNVIEYVGLDRESPIKLWGVPLI